MLDAKNRPWILLSSFRIPSEASIQKIFSTILTLNLTVGIPEEADKLWLVASGWCIKGSQAISLRLLTWSFSGNPKVERPKIQELCSFKSMKWTKPYWIQQTQFVSTALWILQDTWHCAWHFLTICQPVPWFFDVSCIGDAKSHAQLLANETPWKRRGELRRKRGKLQRVHTETMEIPYFDIFWRFGLEDSGLNLVRWKRVAIPQSELKV